MSIEGHSSAPSANVIVEHYCGCGKWEGFGFSANKSVETRWWCGEHSPRKQPISGQVKPQ
jgi:hypothetical protein